MKATHMVVLATVVTGIAASAYAQEKKIQRSELPAAVERTIQEQSQGATIRGFNKETEKGRTFYEAEMLVNGHSKDVLIDSTGQVVEVEEQVEFDSLPAAVKAALEAKAGGAKIAKVESLTKKGKLVAYEAHLRGGKQKEVQVAPDGKPLDHEE